MSKANLQYTRRDFLLTAAAAAGATALPFAPSRAAAKYRRYNVTSPDGQKMLVSYAKGIQAMLDLPASDPRNWFRNAFIHLMDCPHGNWWFYVWHRGYIGYFERTIRALSGDDSFAIPYWDWTQMPKPQIPDAMFDGVLTPTDKGYEPYTGDLARFTAFIKPELETYWNRLSPDQQHWLDVRGYKVFNDLWKDVRNGNPENEAFAITRGARYLSRDNPKFDDKTAYDVSAYMVYSGLQPTDFYNPTPVNIGNSERLFLSFTSSKTDSHEMQPTETTYFSTIEAFPHNKVHNYIGGLGSINPPWGNMTNNLSPVDPIFFLHHSNMDRLWDVWTRKQQALRLPYLPTGDDFKKFADEPFLFYVDTKDGKGNYVGPSKAGDYLISPDVFAYDYEPGFGEDLVKPPGLALVAEKAAPPVRGTVKNNVGSVVVPRATIQSTARRPLMAAVTTTRPRGVSAAREFDVLVNGTYAGTFAFFGPMMSGMNMSANAIFAVPLPKSLPAFTALGAAKAATLHIRVVPSQGQGGPAPKLEAVSVGAS